MLGWLDDSVTAEPCAIRVRSINRSVAVIVESIVARDLAHFGRSPGRRMNASLYGVAESTVQKSPSSQSTGSCTHTAFALQESEVQAFPSSQTDGST